MSRKVVLGVTIAMAALLFGAQVRANLAADVHAEAGEIRRAVAARATVAPRDGVFHVAPSVNGRVTEVLVRVGDRVERGQDLARVEPSGGSQPFDVLGEGESLRAPAAGVVLSRHVEPGDLLGTVVPLGRAAVRDRRRGKARAAPRDRCTRRIGRERRCHGARGRSRDDDRSRRPAHRAARAPSMT
jgi:biotin carboxyl carrier protein